MSLKFSTNFTCLQVRDTPSVMHSDTSHTNNSVNNGVQKENLAK